MHAPSPHHSLPPESAPPKYHWALHRYACFCAGSILFLICIGGLVTSKEAGMSVPDWPTTYGYNMFYFPWQNWVGGIFFEHSHRLVASGVGVLVSILAIWLCFQERVWLRWMGLCVPIFVALEGTLGGLRVVLSENVLGVFHGCLAQLLFIAVSLIALFTSRWWLSAGTGSSRPVVPRQWTKLTLAVTALIFVQLMVGATMRHEHLGLAIHDFPLAYGQVWPSTSTTAVDQYNLNRLAHNEVATTAFAINLQMIHRIGAVLVTLSIITVASIVGLTSATPPVLRNWSAFWVCLVLTQFTLGALTIWTNKAADIATSHVAVGALTLVTGALLTAISWRLQSRSQLATKEVA